MYDLINAPLPKLPKSVKLAVKAKEECLMKKSAIVCMVAVVLISVFVGCSVKNSDVNENAETSSFSASKETTLHISTAAPYHYTIMKRNTMDPYFDHFINDLEQRYHIRVLLVDNYIDVLFILKELNMRIRNKIGRAHV